MNVIDEYDKGAEERDQRRFTVRWKAVDRNVLTDDGPEEKALHIATFASPTVAEHITELHNRTLRDDGEPGTDEGAEDEPGTWQGPAPRLSRYMARLHPTSRTLVHIDTQRAIAETVQKLVDDRVAYFLERQPARIQIDGNPTAMANMLTMLGWKVTAPEPEVDMKEDPR